MARPGNWRELVAEYGWGTAPHRLQQNSKRTPTGCLQYQTKQLNTPQVTVSVGGHSWRMQLYQLAWCIRYGAERMRDDLQVMHTCCTHACIKHVAALRPGTVASVCTYRKQLAAIKRATEARRLLTPDQVDEVWRLLRAGEQHADIAARFGVSGPTISHIAIGLSYKGTGDPIRRHRSPVRLTGEQVADVVDRSLRGERIADIADSYGISVNRVRKITKPAGVAPRKVAVAADIRARARRLRRSGWTLAAIAEKLSIHSTTAGRICRGIDWQKSRQVSGIKGHGAA